VFNFFGKDNGRFLWIQAGPCWKMVQKWLLTQILLYVLPKNICISLLYLENTPGYVYPATNNLLISCVFIWTVSIIMKITFVLSQLSFNGAQEWERRKIKTYWFIGGLTSVIFFREGATWLKSTWSKRLDLYTWLKKTIRFVHLIKKTIWIGHLIKKAICILN
jgi:hypothetical protein